MANEEDLSLLIVHTPSRSFECRMDHSDLVVRRVYTSGGCGWIFFGHGDNSLVSFVLDGPWHLLPVRIPTMDLTTALVATTIPSASIVRVPGFVVPYHGRHISRRW